MVNALDDSQGDDDKDRGQHDAPPSVKSLTRPSARNGGAEATVDAHRPALQGW
jgi:hypothetical protein